MAADYQLEKQVSFSSGKRNFDQGCAPGYSSLYHECISAAQTSLSRYRIHVCMFLAGVRRQHQKCPLDELEEDGGIETRWWLGFPRAREF